MVALTQPGSMLLRLCAASLIAALRTTEILAARVCVEVSDVLTVKSLIIERDALGGETCNAFVLLT